MLSRCADHEGGSIRRAGGARGTWPHRRRSASAHLNNAHALSLAPPKGVLLAIASSDASCVLRTCRARGDALVALKEVPLSDVGLFGATAAEREQGLGRMGKEVDILSSMSHPHVVQYYESFVEGSYLYIAMELVEVTGRSRL